MTGPHQQVHTVRFLSAFACLFPLVLFGCQTTNYQYTPSVQEVTPTGADEASDVRTFVTLDEVKGGEKDGQKGHVSFRLRVENRGSSTVELLPDRIDLIVEDLQKIGSPELNRSGEGSYTLDPAGSLLVTARFPLPASDTPPSERYRQFTLLWSLKIDDRTYSNSTTFKRERPYRERRYRDPYWYDHRYYYDHDPFYRDRHHSGFRFHMGRSYHW